MAKHQIKLWKYDIMLINACSVLLIMPVRNGMVITHDDHHDFISGVFSSGWLALESLVCLSVSCVLLTGI